MSLFLAIATLVFFSFLPLLELRASIPIGFFALNAWFGVAMDWWWVVLICVAANILQGIVVFEILLPILELFRRHWAWFATKVWPHVEKRQQKLKPVVDRYGEWGLAIFIGIPLPGTGALTGAVGAFLLGFERRRFYVANAAGVLLAAIAVTILCLLIQEGAVAEDSFLRSLFLNEKLIEGATP